MNLIAVDPGLHTGFAFFEDGERRMSGMLMTGDHPSIKRMLDLFENFKPDEMVVELFHLFPHKAKEQSWSQLEVPQLIGVIRYWAWERDLPVTLQPPSFKQAFPDARLKKDGDYVENIHARDAIRHGRYYLKFGRGKGRGSTKANNR